MSHYTNGEITVKNPACLISALEEYNPSWKGLIQYHKVAENLYGYHGDKRAQVANVIIRRAQIGGSSNDIGFLFHADGRCEAIVSDYDRHHYGQAWLTRVTALAGVHAVIHRAQSRGERVTRTTDKQGRVQLLVSAR